MKTKKLLKGVMLGCIALAASGLCGCGGPASGKDYEYRFIVSNFYATVNHHSLLTEAWCDEITEKTGGRVVFEYYPSSSLVSANNSYDSVVNEIVDIAMTATANTPGIFPAMSYLELPLGYPDGWVGSKVCNDFIEEFQPEELSKVKVLYTHTVSPMVIMGNRNYQTIQDFSGAIIRGGSEQAISMISALGAQSYSCQITELYEALTKNIVDSVLSGKDILDGYSIGEVVDYVTEDPSFGRVGVIAMMMNRERWEALPPDIQEVFTEVSEKYAELQGRCWKYEDLVAYRNFEANGGQVISLPEAESALVAEKLNPVFENYAESLGFTKEQIDMYRSFIDERIEYWSGHCPSDEEILEWGDTYLTELKEEDP